jgi:hypothetical protein
VLVFVVVVVVAVEDENSFAFEDVVDGKNGPSPVFSSFGRLASICSRVSLYISF